MEGAEAPIVAIVVGSNKLFDIVGLLWLLWNILPACGLCVEFAAGGRKQLLLPGGALWVLGILHGRGHIS